MAAAFLVGRQVLEDLKLPHKLPEGGGLPAWVELAGEVLDGDGGGSEDILSFEDRS